MSRRTVKAFGKDEEEEDLRLCLLGTTVLFLSLRFLYKRKGQTRDRSTEKDETFGRFRVRVPSHKKKEKEEGRPQKKKKTNTTPTTTTETEELTKTLLFLSLFSTFCPIFR